MPNTNRTEAQRPLTAILWWDRTDPLNEGWAYSIGQDDSGEFLTGAGPDDVLEVAREALRGLSNRNVGRVRVWVDARTCRNFTQGDF